MNLEFFKIIFWLKPVMRQYNPNNIKIIMVLTLFYERGLFIIGGAELEGN